MGKSGVKIRIKSQVKGLRGNVSKITKITEQSTMKSMQTNMKDLNRVAGETTPVDDGVLELSGHHGVNKTGIGLQGWVQYEAWNDHPTRRYDFNYAIWIHEETYNLGYYSEIKAGGKGLSGAHYDVGNKYLTRPLYGEAPTYRDIIETNLKAKLGKAK